MTDREEIIVSWIITGMGVYGLRNRVWLGSVLWTVFGVLCVWLDIRRGRYRRALGRGRRRGNGTRKAAPEDGLSRQGYSHM